MPLPLAAVAFCITSATCQERKRTADQFVSGQSCTQFVQQEAHPFVVGAVNMSKFIESSIGHLPAVKSVSVKNEQGRVQVEVAVDDFNWESLAPIYEKELDLSETFKGQMIDFRVVDESPNAGEAAFAG